MQSAILFMPLALSISTPYAEVRSKVVIDTYIDYNVYNESVEKQFR